MKKRNVTRMILIGMISLLMVVTVYASANIVGVEEGYDYLSEDLFEKIHELEDRYPDLLQVVEYGRSVDNRPLYAIRMTEDVKSFMDHPAHHLNRTHYYIDGGNHSRETVNPPLVLRMVEDYARDYYGEENISGFDLKKILEESVLHFLPIPNPDGYDLVKIGLDAVQTKAGLDAIKSVPDTDYSNYKANLRGVDLNRNYPSWVFDTEKKTWVDLREKNPGRITNPSGELYGGPYGASEPEVKYKNEYILNYDFRQFLTFHSRGEVIFWNKYYFPDTYNNQARKMAEIVNQVNGYRIGGLSTGGGSGYFSDFTAGMTFKPTVTVETTPGWTALPSDRKWYRPVYEEIRLLPLFIREEGEKTGYHEYKLYREGQYIRDFPLKDYAEAKAEKFGGEVISYPGLPVEGESHRISGRNRYETAVKISQHRYDHSETVILVRGDDEGGNPQVVDALSSSALAGVENAPILLTLKHRIPEATKKEIGRLGAQKILIVGGYGAVSEDVENILAGEDLQVERLRGQDRIMTAVEVAKRVLEKQPTDTAIIAGSRALVDSLLAGPLAHKEGYPVLLVDGGDNAETKRIIEKYGIENLIIIGGQGVVSGETEENLQGIISGEITRIGGSNREETSLILAETYFGENEGAVIVNGYSYVDAVAGSILEEPILYTHFDRKDVRIGELIGTKKDFYGIGGTSVISYRLLVYARHLMEN